MAFERVTLKPVSPDLKVRLPDHDRYLAADGEELELTYYWRRRIDDGDVVIVPDAVAPKGTRKNSANSGE